MRRIKDNAALAAIELQVNSANPSQAIPLDPSVKLGAPAPEAQADSELNVIIESLKPVVNALTPEKITVEVRKKIVSLVKLLQRLSHQHIPKLQNKPEPKHAATKKITDPTLAELDRRLAVVRDRVRGVAKHGLPGFYLYGRAGTSKTHTVRTTLERLGCDYVYHLGHLTPIGLFELLEENSTKVIVLDDVSTIFGQPTALSILLAALGKQPDGKRVIKYKRHGRTAKVDFEGGIIAISNLELHGDAVVEALKSRVQTLNYDPSDEHIAALLYHIASNGHVSPEGEKMAPKECRSVADYLLEKSKSLGLRPDVRMLVDKAFADYIQWKAGDTETHWKDLVFSALQDRLVELQHPKTAYVPTKKEEEAEELRVLEEIVRKYSTKQDRLDAFVTATGKSQRSYQRRMRQLKAMGRLPRSK